MKIIPTAESVEVKNEGDLNNANEAHVAEGVADPVIPAGENEPKESTYPSTYPDIMITLGIIALSATSALNSSFVRSEKLTEFTNTISRADSNNAWVISELSLSLINRLALIPELLHNARHNMRFKHIWREIVGERKNSKQENGEQEAASYSGKNMLWGMSVLLASVPIALAHFIVFYDANAQMFLKDFEIKITEDSTYNTNGTWPLIFCLTLASLGSI
ncbi:MAG: hypothetical protein K0S27_1339 [Gammaproteobacteria bacterium]|jgi:hypothetical protein|nr:hypothetical protein [Gammaproteobacteria bacterium]